MGDSKQWVVRAGRVEPASEEERRGGEGREECGPGGASEITLTSECYPRSDWPGVAQGPFPLQVVPWNMMYFSPMLRG